MQAISEDASVQSNVSGIYSDKMPKIAYGYIERKI
jgi:hypothetical protein